MNRGSREVSQAGYRIQTVLIPEAAQRINLGETTELLDTNLSDWATTHPVIEAMDADHVHMMQLLRGEVAEVLEELQKPYSLYDAMETLKEVIDILCFVFSYSVSAKIEPDFSQVLKITNGQGRKSDVLEKIIALSQQYEFLKDMRIFHELVATCLSFLAYSDHETIGVSTVIGVVRAKNERNYPAEYFQSSRHPQFTKTIIGQKDPLQLTKQEIADKYNHVSSSLRFLRDLWTLPTGLPAWTHQLYAPLIHDFDNPQQAYALLKKLAEKDKQIILGTKPDSISWQSVYDWPQQRWFHQIKQFLGISFKDYGLMRQSQSNLFSEQSSQVAQSQKVA